MDKSHTDLTSERSKSTNLNGNSGSRRSLSGGGGSNNNSLIGSPIAGVQGRAIASLLDGGTHHPLPHHVLRVVVNMDEKGYGMKVSGDNPVYVQSVKEGGPAEKAGLSAGDKIIAVNGVDVMESTHTEVVALIRSSQQVILTVQQSPLRGSGGAMGSPHLHPNRQNNLTPHATQRITGPKPVDHEKRKQFQLERVQTIRLMLEEEQRYVDSLRSDLARYSSDEKKLAELTNAERNVATLQSQLQAILSGQNELLSPNTNVPNNSLKHHMSIPELLFRNTDSNRKDTDNSNNATNTFPASNLKNHNHPHSKIPHSNTFPPPIGDSDTPPPLPKRNKPQQQQQQKPVTATENQIFFQDESSNLLENRCQALKPPKNINALFLDFERNNSRGKKGPKSLSPNIFGSKNSLRGSPSKDDGKRVVSLKKSNSNPTRGVMVENTIYEGHIPPPLPPRFQSKGNNSNTRHFDKPDGMSSKGNGSRTSGSNSGIPESNSFASKLFGIDSEPINSLNKQMTYPLVATCATLVNNYPSPHLSNHTHHRTKSSPDTLTIVNAAEASQRLIASESLNDLSQRGGRGGATPGEGWETAGTPPGTPPPPYPSPLANKKHITASSSSNRNSANTEDGDDEGVSAISPDVSPLRNANSVQVGLIATSSPIQAAQANIAQQPIISMEDDDVSDQEVMEDHGPFKSLSRLWEYVTHLAVFMNYVLSNSDPSSLLFYLLTDLYKEGNAKDMRKWAYEIHSSFLVPGAPLRLSNVDENIAREIDDVLSNEWDKEEILRKIFWKARNRAKEELNEQLADFQQKRTAGLGTIFGPPDAKLEEISRDKAKEMKLYETLLLNKLDNYLSDIEKETADPRRYLTAAALATVITKVFGVRGTHTAHSMLDRCPQFVSKDKSFRTRLLGKYSRKLNVNGHHYVAQHYYTVISCNNCHQIIYGIGPQGYQCSVCLINLHRQCVKQYEDTCPGPIPKKDRGIGKFMDRIRPDNKDSRRKPLDRDKRSTEEKDGVADHDFSCDRPSGQPVSRSSSDKRPDAVTEETLTKSTENTDSELLHDNHHHDNLHNIQRARSSQPGINRSESYKEQSQKRRQIRERRKISDPNLPSSKSNDLSDPDHHELSYQSGSSSNSSLSSRSSESPPSTSLDAVPGSNAHNISTQLDSDMEIEPDTPDWQSCVSEEVLSRLHPEEKKRQEIINELFHTERSHVRNLKVLETVFYRPLYNSRILPPDQFELLFSNLDEMLEIHGAFNSKMKQRRKEEVVVGDIGELLLSMFDGPAGETFQLAAAKFCARQQLALESLKELRKRDNRLHMFLKDCESDRLCKRFQLKDIIPTGMQRLVKYPLLFESLVRCTERVQDSTMRESITSSGTPQQAPQGPNEELSRLRRAVERSKEILNYVNKAVKEAEDKARLQELQRRLDKTAFEKNDHPLAAEFKNLDLTNHKLIFEGSMIWRINKQKFNLHVVLMEEIILLLQKQDEKYVLKFYNSMSGGERPHSPIIKVCTALVRRNAAAKDSLFLVNTSHNGAQIYDLVAPSPSDYKIWFKHISDATEAYKCREGKSRRSELSTPENESEPISSLSGGSVDSGLPAGGQTTDANTTVTESSNTNTETDGQTDSGHTSAHSSQRNSGVMEDDENTNKDKDSADSNKDNANAEGGSVVGQSSNKREAHMRLATEDQPLIQPSEVTVNLLPVHTAQPIVTPIEQVRRKDEAIRQALAEKEALVAEILEVPPEEYHMIVDMAGDNVTGDKEPTELVLAAINQANQLWSVVSESLNITDVDTVLATSSQNPTCTSSPPKSNNNLPSVPSHKIQDIASTLNSQLTALLKIVKEREDERERLRRENHKLREHMHTLNDAQLKLDSSINNSEHLGDGDSSLHQNPDLDKNEKNLDM